MSIWASFGIFDGEDHPRPIRYRRSHVLPSPDDDRAGALDLACIPGFVTRDGRDDGPEDDDRVWPWLRLHVTEDDDEEGATVVLDAHQVAQLHDELGIWLERARRGPGGDRVSETSPESRCKPSDDTEGYTGVIPAGKSLSGDTGPVYGALVEPPKPYDPEARRGTWQHPVVPPADVARIRKASHLAITVLPGELGRLVHREMREWCDVGQRFGGHGQMLAIAADLEQRHNDLILGRTYG